MVASIFEISVIAGAVVVVGDGGGVVAGAVVVCSRCCSFSGLRHCLKLCYIQKLFLLSTAIINFR